MRQLFTLVLACSLIGCGSKSSTPESATAESTVTVDMPASAAGNQAASTSTSKSSPVAALQQRAQAAVAARQPQAAIEALSQAIGIDPSDSHLFHMRADVYNLIGEYANARADYSLAVQADPQNAELYNTRGYFLMTRGATADAIVDFNKAVELNPKFPVAWNNRGLIRLGEKNYDAAIADFSKAIELDSKYIDALNNRGFASMKCEKLDAALVDLKRTVDLKPDYTTAWNNCGLVYMQQQNYVAAVSAFSKAIELAPLDARWLNHRYAALQKLEKFSEANADAQRIRWLDGLSQLTQQANQKPNDPNIWMNRAEHLVQGDEFGGAVLDYTRVLALVPGNKTALLGRAESWLKLSDAQKAIADCNLVIADDSSPMAHSIRGDAWLTLQDFDKAIADFEMAQRMDDALVTAYQQRAAQRQQAGDKKLAEDDIAKAKHLQDALAGLLTPRTAQEQVPFPTN